MRFDLKFPFIHRGSAPVSVLPPAGPGPATTMTAAPPTQPPVLVKGVTTPTPQPTPVSTAKSTVLAALEAALADLASKKAALEAAQSVVSSLESEWQAALSDIEGAFRGAAGVFSRAEAKVVSLL